MESNQKLVDSLVSKGFIESEIVEEAFRNVDRKNFVPLEYEDKAYIDRPLPLLEGSTISAPHMVAISTELLELSNKHKVLEIGSGSGYQIAIIAEIVEHVIGVEIEKDLVEKSRKALENLDNVHVLEGSGLAPVDQKFDRILFSCAISQEKFEESFKHLEKEGIAVAPVEEDNRQVLKRFINGGFEEHTSVRFTGFKQN